MSRCAQQQERSTVCCTGHARIRGTQGHDSAQFSVLCHCKMVPYHCNVLPARSPWTSSTFYCGSASSSLQATSMTRHVHGRSEKRIALIAAKTARVRCALPSCPTWLALPCATQMATQIVGSLLALEAMDENADIRIYINSTGTDAVGCLLQ